MATPITADRILALMKEWNIPFKEYKDWRNHNRNHKGAWGPVNGLVIHHTGTDNADQRDLLYDGYASLPGPLCQVGLDQRGVIHLIGWGRCNHAGLGDAAVLQHVIHEDYVWDKNLNPSVADTDGNSRFYGMEIWYDGTHDMTAAQSETMRRFSAMICTEHNWGARSVIGHGEWQIGKWDPGYKDSKIMNMWYQRQKIQEIITAGPKTPIPPTIPPKPPTLEQRVKALEDRVSKLEK